MAIIYFCLAVISLVATGLLVGAAVFGLLVWSITRDYDDDDI